MTNDDKKKDAWMHRRRRLAASLAFLCVAVLYFGVTYTWFVGNQSASTVAKIAKPSNLQILGPNSTAIVQLDLTYDASNIDEGSNVTVRRGFCVDSGGEPFELQLANTTNIEGLELKVYYVEVNGSNKDLVVGSSTTWSKSGSAIDFTFINNDGTDIATTPVAGDQTFNNYANVQANAAPLYRYHNVTKNVSKGELDTNEEGEVANVTNFIIEATWKESVKETDVVYLIARNTSPATDGN